MRKRIKRKKECLDTLDAQTFQKRDPKHWTNEDYLQFFISCGVVTRVSVYGLHRAASVAFRRMGYRLATIYDQDTPHVVRFSCYATAPDSRKAETVMCKLALEALAFMGFLAPVECFAMTISGSRLVIEARLPDWVQNDYRLPGTEGFPKKQP